MSTRTLVVTLTLTVRDMTAEEFEYANEGAVEDNLEIDGDPAYVVEYLEPGELREAIEGALASEGNPEMFAGSGLFCITENAHVQSIEWESPAHV